jgi:hypothetical protein
MCGTGKYFLATNLDDLKAFIIRMQDSYTNPYETKRIEYFEIFVFTKPIHDTGISKKFL